MVGLRNADMWTDTTGYYQIYNPIYLFHMPLFFVLSGFVFKGEQREWPAFMGKLSATMVLPYFLWVYVFISMKLLATGEVNSEISPWAYVQVFYSPVSVFWFLYVLFFMQVIAKYVLEKFGLAWLVMLVMLVEMRFMYDLKPYAGDAVNLVCEFLIYFVLGRLIADKTLLKNPRKPIWALAAFAGFGVVLTVSVMLGAMYFNLGGRLAAIPLVILLVLGFRWADGWRPMQSRIVTFLGTRTMPIYVMHVLFTACSRILLNKLGIHDLGTHMVIGTLLGLAGPLVAYEVFKKGGALPWLGLGGKFKRPALA